MRCLFTAKTGSLGHLLPLLPLADAARAAGDEVAVASCADRRDYVEAAGHTFYVAGLAREQVSDRMRLVAQGLKASGLQLHPRWGWDLEHTYAEAFTTVHAPIMADDLAPVVEAFAPDVMVCDLADFGGPVAAAVAGVPCASHAFGLPLPEALAREAGRWATPMWNARNMVSPDDGGMYGDLHFSICPPSLDPGDGWAGAPVQLIRPAVRPGSPQPWLDAFPARPTVYVTLGTSPGRDVDLLDVALSGLVDLDLNVIVTVGVDGDPAQVEQAWPNVSAHRFVPQDDLLPACSLVVCHGGSGTVLGALGHGVPVVVLPHMADHYRNADAVRRAGCGLVIDDDAQTPANVCAAVRMAMADQSIGAKAVAVKTEIAAMPSPSIALIRLHDLALGRRAPTSLGPPGIA